MAEGNTLFLICTPCSENDESDYGLKLASRSKVGWYEHDAPTHQMDAWLSKHRKCGNKREPDHFRLGLLHNPNHDHPKLPEVKESAQAVHEALNS